MGVRWKEKGGDRAVDVLRGLHASGVEATLDIVGCRPPQPVSEPELRVIPFLDKNVTAESEKLMELYRRAHFLLLPTRNECFGYVFGEANAFGVPALTTRTGGVPDVVHHGRNGLLFPESTDAASYVEAICGLLADREKYARLVDESRRAYEERLNWDVWGKAVGGMMREMVSGKVSGSSS